MAADEFSRYAKWDGCSFHDDGDVDVDEHDVPAHYH